MVTTSGEKEALTNEELSREELLKLVDDLTDRARRQDEWLKQQDDQIQQLQKSQESLILAVRQFMTGFPFCLLIILRKEQRIKAANKIASEYFQYSEDELGGQPISVLFPDVERFEQKAHSLRLIGRKKSGETFAVEIFVNPLQIRGEDLLFVSVQDVNERHRLEQLRRDLAAMVSHDLRAPLTALRVTLEMVSEGVYGDLSERGNRLLKEAVVSVEYLNALVGTLLEAEKAEDGAIELEYAETTIGLLIKTAINAVHVPDRPATVKIETEFTNDCITVDEHRIVQVLINLITNAVKYSPENAVVTVSGGIEGVNARFEVMDEGPGIPLEMRTVVFERYRQLGQPRGVKRKGFGLGLAICKALIEKHNGRIWIESGEGNRGSRFCFTVPISP